MSRSICYWMICVGFGVLTAGQSVIAADASKTSTAHDFKVKSLAGDEVELGKKYQGRVLLVVNVASQCGLTPQYEQLQALHEKYGQQGLAVLGFPCNQFGRQEPGTPNEIESFCKKNYGVTFDMFEKIDVNGGNANPLYKHLTKASTKPKGAGKVSWNFEKFLIDRDGQVIARFQPGTKPDDPKVIAEIEKTLKGS